MRVLWLGAVVWSALSAQVLQGCSAEQESSPSSASARWARDIRIGDVAIYQVVKIPLVKDGQAVVERNAPVMQGKDALLRVFVQPLPAFKARELEVELAWRSAAGAAPLFVHQLISGASEESSLESTINFAVPGASITAEASWSVTLREIDPVAATGSIDVGARYPNAGGELEALHPRYVGPLRVMLVPYRYRADGSGRVPDVSDEQLARYRAFLARYYPVSEVILELHEPVDYEHVVDPASGWDEFLDIHCALRASEQPASNVFYYGLIEPTRHALEYADGAVGRSFIPEPADAQGRCSVGLGFSGGGSAIIMSHELGHALGLRHAPCGADDAGPYPYADGKIGSWGFDSTSRSLMAPDARYDLMSVCTPVFISDYTYLKAFERLRYVHLQLGETTRPDAGDDLGGKGATTGTRCGAALPVACAQGAEKCCDRSVETSSCVAASAPCTCDVAGCNTVEMHCDGPEDCGPGQVCCGTLEAASSSESSEQAARYVDLSCQTECDPAHTRRIVCHQANPLCPIGTICSHSQLLSNIQICTDPETTEW